LGSRRARLPAPVVRAFCFAAALASLPALAVDPLPSWNDSGPKQAVLSFVDRVTSEGGKDFVPPRDRIAVFDDDGTLWPEQPVVEVAFASARLQELAAKDPSLRSRQPYKAALEGDTEFLRKAGPGALAQILALTHGGMSQERFAEEARAFFQTARHPKLGVPYTALAYAPMVELLSYLRANGFQTWICTGGTTDFVRVFSEQMYGIPPQQVIGSTMEKEWREPSGELWRTGKPGRLNDKAQKPVGIDLQIGKRPLLAAGNVRSAGDVEMLRYAQARHGPSLELVIDHDDGAREFAYQEAAGTTLSAAKASGWTVVSMKRDWAAIFRKPGAQGIPIDYLVPKSARLRPYYDRLMQWRVLEELGDLLSFVQLPAPLTLRAKECGQSDAFYDPRDQSVTFCYELLDELVQAAPAAAAQGLSPDDAIAGPFVFLFLHEVGHAVFDLTRVPILGREEDAADQFAVYALLRAGPELARTVLAGAAFMYARGAAVRDMDEGDLADVHPLDSQRYYNVLCLASGAGQKQPPGSALPDDRAMGCAYEFSQVQTAMEQLVAPRSDPWLRVKSGEAALRAGLEVKRRLSWAKGMARPSRPPR
jgi:phosphoserine phosphatase